MARFILNETSYFGAGIRNELSNEVKARGFKKALLVSDKVLDSCGVLQKVKDVLDKGNISYETFWILSKTLRLKTVKTDFLFLIRLKRIFLSP